MKITARTIVEAVVMDMLIEHCINHDIAPEDAGIFFSVATERRRLYLRGAEKHVLRVDDPMEILAVDALVGIETVAFENAGDNDALIFRGAERAILSTFLLAVETIARAEEAQVSRG